MIPDRCGKIMNYTNTSMDMDKYESQEWCEILMNVIENNKETSMKKNTLKARSSYVKYYM